MANGIHVENLKLLNENWSIDLAESHYKQLLDESYLKALNIALNFLKIVFLYFGSQDYIVFAKSVDNINQEMMPD